VGKKEIRSHLKVQPTEIQIGCTNTKSKKIWALEKVLDIIISCFFLYLALLMVPK
jgi:hypothetical protein